MPILYYVKVGLLCLLAACFLYGVAFLFPRKLRLLQRVGLNKGNADLIALARSGDSEAAALHRDTKRLLWVAIPTVLLLAIVNGITRR